MRFTRQREITGEPLNSRSRILAPNKREITGVDCITCWVLKNFADLNFDHHGISCAFQVHVLLQLEQDLTPEVEDPK